mgnify:FL=1
MLEVKNFTNGFVIVDGKDVICGGTDKTQIPVIWNRLMSENVSSGGLDSNIIKSIQRGTTSDTNVAINTVNPDKCIVLLNNSLLSTTSDNVDGAYVVKLKANSLELASNYFNRDNYTVGWQIIEFR